MNKGILKMLLDKSWKDLYRYLDQGDIVRAKMIGKIIVKLLNDFIELGK